MGDRAFRNFSVTLEVKDLVSENLVNELLSSCFYWVQLGWSEFVSQEALWCCVLNNTPVFGYCQAVLAQHQGLPCFSLCSLLPPSESRLRVGKRWGGDTAETADPKWPKEYSVLYDIMRSI